MAGIGELLIALKKSAPAFVTLGGEPPNFGTVGSSPHDAWLDFLARGREDVTVHDRDAEDVRELRLAAQTVEAMAWLLEQTYQHLDEYPSADLDVACTLQGQFFKLAVASDVGAALDHLWTEVAVGPPSAPAALSRAALWPLVRDWGAGLSADDLRSAVASAGALPVTSAHRARYRVPWSLSRLRESLRNSDAAAHARRWRTNTGETAGVTLEILGWLKRVPLGPAGLIDELSRTPSVKSVRFRSPAQTPSRAWDWPLDIGFLDDEASQSLRAAVEHQYWQKFIRIVDAKRASDQLDLLLVPGSPTQARRLLPDRSQLPDVHTVVSIGNPAGEGLDALESLRASAGAAASAAAPVERGKESQWLDFLLNNLAHDLPLDEVLFGATDARPLIVSGPRGIGAARTSAALKKLSRRIEGLTSDAFLPPRMTASLMVSAAAPPKELARSLLVGAERLDWKSEDHTASDIVELSAKTPARRDGRFAQAALLTPDGERLDRLRPGSRHRLDVRIARPDAKWASAPVAFPAHELPEDPDGHDLTVVFMAPGVTKEPMSQSLWLPPTADSDPCSFAFRVPKMVQRLKGRVTVLYRNRILQTLSIDAGAESQLKIGLEAVLTADLSAVSRGPGFHASFLFNDTNGEKGVTGFNDEASSYVRLTPRLKELLTKLKFELEKITRRPQDFATLGSPQSADLLVTLARMGWQFGNRLSQLPGMQSILQFGAGTERRIQVMTADPDDPLIPLEIVYDARFPKATATVCDGWKLGSDAAKCQTSCAGNSAVVCPLGFWGLRHVIERRLYDETVAREIQDKGADAKFTAQAGVSRSALPALNSVLFAAADKAEAFDAGAFNSTLGEMEAHAAKSNVKLNHVKNWTTWTTAVANDRPELLMLLPHAEEEKGASVLVIGTDALASPEVTNQHVSDPPRSPEPGPVVVLYGCRTALDEVPFSSFVSAFRNAQASVVIATMSTVLGRHMIRVAQETFELLTEKRTGRTSVGELVRKIRHRLLRKDLPVAMTVVAYGEVDWELQ